MDTTQFNGAFWIAMAASVSGFIVVVLTSLNKSKCTNVKCCCGLFSCVRDTQAEAEIEEKQILDAWKEGYDLAINGERIPKL